MRSRVAFRVVVALMMTPTFAYSVNVDLRRPGYSMEHVRQGNQYGGTCYAESAAMAMDAFRYSWLGSPTNTYVDAVHLGILESVYVENETKDVSENENAILRSINDGSFNAKLLSFAMEGGYPHAVIQRALDHGFCINVDQTHSILTRLGDAYNPISSFETFYAIYNYYQHSEWDLLKYDLYLKPIPMVQDHTIVAHTYPYSYLSEKKSNVPENAGSSRRKLQQADVFIKDLSFQKFDQRFTPKDTTAYSKFLKDIYEPSDTYSLNSVEFLDKLTTESCSLDKKLTPNNAESVMYYFNEGVTIASRDEMQKKKNIVHAYFSIATKNNYVQPLILGYCLNDVLPMDEEECGYHASLIVGIQPNINGTHDLILRNTSTCLDYYNSQNITCSKSGDYYIEESTLLKTVRILSSVVPIMREEDVDRTDLSPAVKNKLIDGWNYMVQAKQIQLQ